MSFFLASFHSLWNYLFSRARVAIRDTSVYVRRNDSAASAIYFLSLLSYLKSQPISLAHFKERRNKRRPQAGSSELVWVSQNVRCHFGLAEDYLHTQMHKPGPASGILEDMEWIASCDGKVRDRVSKCDIMKSKPV